MKGSSFDLLLVAASASGMLPTLITKLLEFNEGSKESMGESIKGSQTRAALFDLTFLMLIYAVQCFDSDTVLAGMKPGFFHTWARECMLEEGRIKSLYGFQEQESQVEKISVSVSIIRRLNAGCVVGGQPAAADQHRRDPHPGDQVAQRDEQHPRRHEGDHPGLRDGGDSGRQVQQADGHALLAAVLPASLHHLVVVEVRWGRGWLQFEIFKRLCCQLLTTFYNVFSYAHYTNWTGWSQTGGGGKPVSPVDIADRFLNVTSDSEEESLPYLTQRVQMMVSLVLSCTRDIHTMDVNSRE